MDIAEGSLPCVLAARATRRSTIATVKGAVRYPDQTVPQAHRHHRNSALLPREKHRPGGEIIFIVNEKGVASCLTVPVKISVKTCGGWDFPEFSLETPGNEGASVHGKSHGDSTVK